MRNESESPQPAAKVSSRLNFNSLKEAIDAFVCDLNSGSPSISLSTLDSSGTTYGCYQGLEFRLEVPSGFSDNNLILQTWFEHSKRAAGINSRIVDWNKSLQQMGSGGKLTFRNLSGKVRFGSILNRLHFAYVIDLVATVMSSVCFHIDQIH